MKTRRHEYSLLAFVVGVVASPQLWAFDNLTISTEPLAVSTEKVEPNVVLVMDTSGSMGSRVSGTNKTRMEVAKEVAKEVIEDVDGVRFGMFNLNYRVRKGNSWVYYEGGSISSNTDRHGNTYYAECGALTKDQLKTVVDGFSPGGNTPVAETLYEVTRYFRGMRRYFGGNVGALGSNNRYHSPIQYRCQKNYAVVISDGLPTSDDSVPTNDPAGNARDWAGSAGNTRYALDDVAKFANDIDFLTASEHGTDIKGGSWDDPAFPQQNMQTYTIGFALDDKLLDQTASLGGGLSWVTNDADELKDALTSALSDIVARSLSSSSPAASSGTVQSANIFYPSYNSLDWSGELTKVDENGNEVWKASEKMPGYSSRKIFFNNNGSAQGFTWNNIKNSSFRDIFDFATRVGSNGKSVVDYLRGDSQNESSTVYRPRNSLLGDIVNSSPVYVGAPSFRYPYDLEAASYSEFQENMENREEMVYVGANDGMLHGFDSSGREKFAFIPMEVMRRLPELSNPNYTHRYYVDGTPTVVDAYIKANGTGNKGWRSVLVSGLNAGGQSVFAIDVTNPNQLNANSFLWEFTDEDLGYTYSRPAIVRLADGTWAAVFGNGYNSTQKSHSDDNQVSSTGNAVLYIVNLENGNLIKKIDTGVGADDDPVAGMNRPNGLGTVAPVDYDLDSVVDYVYAGDLFGNLWKFDLTPRNKNNPSSMRMEVAFNGNPLFTARYNSGGETHYQPILVAPDARPTVANHPRGGFMVYFGTGKYIETTDRSLEGAGMQSFYAIWDKNDNSVSQTPVSGRSVLLQQTIEYEGSSSFNGVTNEVRVTSNKKPNWSRHLGWYMDFNQSSPHYERVVTTATIRNGKVIFPTTIPLLKDDPCDSSSDSWVMDLDALTGSRLTYSPFDLNNDGIFSTSDYYAGTTPVSGMKFNEALPKPVITNDEDHEVKIFSQTTQFIENKGLGFEGRQSWREIQEN